MVAQHTPGPWHRNIPPATKYTVVWSGRNTHVAAVKPGGLPPEVVEANLNLLAAAPDLLVALDRLAQAAFARDNVMDDPCRLLEAKAELAAAAESARVAIAKAKGL